MLYSAYLIRKAPGSKISRHPKNEEFVSGEFFENHISPRILSPHIYSLLFVWCFRLALVFMSFCCFLSFNSPPEGIDWINILFLLASKEQDGYFQFICIRLIFLSNKGPDDHNNGSQKQQEAGIDRSAGANCWPWCLDLICISSL